MSVSETALLTSCTSCYTHKKARSERADVDFKLKKEGRKSKETVEKNREEKSKFFERGSRRCTRRSSSFF